MARAALNPADGTAISRRMCVSEILAMLPEAGPVVAQYGLSCFSCEAREFETLEEGCRSHGFPDEEIDDLVSDLNELLQSRPPRPQTLSVSAAAALRLRAVLAAEEKAGWVLVVGVPPRGPLRDMLSARVW